MDSDTQSSPSSTYPSATAPPSRQTAWPSFLMFLAVLVAGVALGWLLFGAAGEAAETPGETPAEVPPTSVLEEEAPTDVESTAIDEPVAAVAEAVLPSVVQIEAAGGVGSGVIYDSDGLILTAAHVVVNSRVVQVRLSDGSQYEGEVLGGDIGTDIAVVRVDTTGLPAAELALDSDLQVGQLAVAMGSPFGLDSTVTAGVVSAVNQTVAGPNDFQSLIQTDAAINPGNSGGALANRAGEVIGINVSIYSTSGGNVGVGFAVPIDVAYDLAQAVVAGEPIERAALGITGTNTESGTAGALVVGVQPNSGADDAGILRGDVIVSIDGVRVNGIGDLVAQIRNYQPGDSVELEVIRGGEEITVEVTLGTQRP